MRLDWDQWVFGKLCDFSGYMLDKGYVKAWFTWLGWVTIVAGLIAFGLKGKSWIVTCLGFLSGIVLLFVALVAAEKLASNLAGTLRMRKAYIRWIIILFLLAITPAIVVEILTVALKVVLKNAV